jgi:hypothetical protein
METKSLLMGLIFLKLQEFRMSTSEISNEKLKHVTVIEEAHNLLRRTSFEQSQEGSNLQGKSVEMISNAIAEMRTYGEGFIIADQAPGLLDQSVIRNTNTKIILRLPEWDDRNLVGKSANLKEDQIEELARLNTGCAAVYQNNWQEAVLCQFPRFDGEKKHPFNYSKTKNRYSDARQKAKTELIRILVNAKLTNQEPAELANEKLLDQKILYYPEYVYRLKNKTLDINETLVSLISLEKILDSISHIENIDIYTSVLIENLSNSFEDIRENEKTLFNNLCLCVLVILGELKPEAESLFKEQIEKIELSGENVL